MGTGKGVCAHGEEPRAELVPRLPLLPRGERKASENTALCLSFPPPWCDAAPRAGGRMDKFTARKHSVLPDATSHAKHRAPERLAFGGSPHFNAGRVIFCHPAGEKKREKKEKKREKKEKKKY